MLRVTNRCPHAGHFQSGRFFFSNARLLTTINAFRGRCHPLDDVFGNALRVVFGGVSDLHPIHLLARTLRFLPDSIQIVCILPATARESGQTRKSPKTFLSQSSCPLIDVGRIDGPGALEVSIGSRTPSSLLLPIGQSRILGVPL